MILAWWDRFASLGLHEGLDLYTQRAVGLINRLSIIAIAVFFFSTFLPGLLTLEPIKLVLSSTNMTVFALVLYANYRQRYSLAQAIVLGFGLLIVSFLNILFDSHSGSQINYLNLLILSVCILHGRKIMVAYYFLTLVSFLGIFYYQLQYPPLIPLSPLDTQVNLWSNLFINLFIISYLLVWFFLGLQRQYERVLQQQNQQLEDQHQALQHAHTDLKQAQGHLIQAEKMASLGQLTAGIAHEINNPINFVSGSVGPLQRDLEEVHELLGKVEQAQDNNTVQKTLEEAEWPELLAEMKDLLQGLENGARRTQEIVAGLRNFSRLDEEIRKTVDLHEGLDSTLALLTHRLKNNIQVHKDYGELPPVKCMPGPMNQVFMNVLSNAIEALEGKGEIFITTQTTADPAPGVAIHVRDTGRGMDEATQSRMFEPFFTTKEVGQGTGLGLSIAYGIIQQHDGQIKVESEVGAGTEVRVWLGTSSRP